MKTKVFSGIDTEHLISSAIYLVVAIIMVICAFPAGILKGSSFAVLLLNIGLIFFFFALMRPWMNAKYYFIQFAIIFVIFSLLMIIRMILKFKLTEDLMWISGGVCIDAFIGSLIGIIAYSEGLKCILYSSASVALLGIFIMFPQTLSPDPELSNGEVLSASLSLVFQFALVAFFSRLASFEGRVSRFNQNVILVSGIVLILMGVWGILAFKITDWLFGIRIWSTLEFISGIIALYGYGVANMAENQASPLV